MKTSGFSFRSTNNLFKLIMESARGENVLEKPIATAIKFLENQKLIREAALVLFIDSFLKAEGSRINPLVLNGTRDYLHKILTSNLDNPASLENMGKYNPYKGIRKTIEEKITEAISSSFRDVLCENVRALLLEKFKMKVRAFENVLELHFMKKHSITSASIESSSSESPTQKNMQSKKSNGFFHPEDTLDEDQPLLDTSVFLQLTQS